MALYCYTVPGGPTIEELFDTGHAPRAITRGNVTYYRDIDAEHGKKPTRFSGWPILSDALGVHPEQIPEAQRELQQHGIHAEFTPDGRMQIESRAHQKQILRATKFCDLAGYD